MNSTLKDLMKSTLSYNKEKLSDLINSDPILSELDKDMQKVNLRKIQQNSSHKKQTRANGFTYHEKMQLLYLWKCDTPPKEAAKFFNKSYMLIYYYYNSFKYTGLKKYETETIKDKLSKVGLL
jgi:hypothetical protein